MLQSVELSTLDSSERWARIRSVLNSAIKILLDRDMDLLASGAHEQAICHRLAVYLEQFTDLNVDCEYNRNMRNPKQLKRGELFRPDIIIHRRLSNEENVLVIETKVRSHGQVSDVRKIQELVEEQGVYHYWAGAFIEFKNNPRIVLREGRVRIWVHWIVNGDFFNEEFSRDIESPLKEKLTNMA